MSYLAYQDKEGSLQSVRVRAAGQGGQPVLNHFGVRLLNQELWGRSAPIRHGHGSRPSNLSRKPFDEIRPDELEPPHIARSTHRPPTGPLSYTPSLVVQHEDPPHSPPTPEFRLPSEIPPSQPRPLPSYNSLSGSAPVPVAALVLFMSAHDIAVGWPATRDFLNYLVEGLLCPLAAIIGHLAEGVARVGTIDTERAALQANVTQLESEALEWWRDYHEMASVKRPRAPDAAEV